MGRLSTQLREQRAYFLAFLIVWLVAFIPQLTHTQQDIFLAINRHNSPLLDRLFFYLTWLGDGLTAFLLVIVLLLISYRQAILAALMFIFTAILAQILKNLVFADHFRPMKTLAGSAGLHIPSGVEMLYNHSFPSGHTTTAFAMATFAVLVWRGRLWWLWLLLAVGVGYSRIYLTHHYPADVLAGAMLGTVGGLLVFVLADMHLPAALDKKKLL